MAGSKIDSRIHVLVGILENSEGQICISQRPKGKHLEGYWEFPGGKKDEGESAFEALVREFQEEIGVEIKEAHPWFQIEHEYPNQIYVLLDIWKIDLYTGTPESKEGQVVRMVSRNDLSGYVFPEGNKIILERLS